MRTAASISAPAAAWVPLAHGVLGIGWWSGAAYITLTTAAAFGIGWEVGDGGTAAALFLILAGAGGLMLASVGAWTPLFFASLPALISAPAAYAGGALREQRSHPRITAKDQSHSDARPDASQRLRWIVARGITDGSAIGSPPGAASSVLERPGRTPSGIGPKEAVET